MDYKIQTITVNGYAANGVYTSLAGAWLGETDWQNDTQVVMPFVDEDGDYVPAPEHWRDLIIAEL